MDAILCFGSRARGDAFDDSDMDVAVLLSLGRGLERSDYLAVDRATERWPAVSVQLLTREAMRPSGFVLELARAYRILWESQPGRVAATFADVTAQASAMGAERRLTPSGDAYWVGV